MIFSNTLRPSSIVLLVGSWLLRFTHVEVRGFSTTPRILPSTAYRHVAESRSKSTCLFEKKSTDSKAETSSRLLDELFALIEEAPQNGIDTPDELQKKITDKCEALRATSPHPQPCQAPSLLSGFWKMLYTDYSPAGPSSGKLGPFIGDVYQELMLSSDNETGPNKAIARNIFSLQFPPINGELQAAPKVQDDTTVAITFDKVGTKVFGLLPLGPNIEFPKGQEIRLWDHIYVDDTHRILYAKNSKPNEDGNNPEFLYVMKRADEERFSTGVFGDLNDM